MPPSPLTWISTVASYQVSLLYPCLNRAARVNVLKYKSYHVIPLFKNPCNGFSFYSVKKPKSLQGLCDLDSYFLLTSSLHSLPHPLSDHTGPLIPRTSQAFASSLYLTSTRLTPLLPSGPVWLSHHLLRPTVAILFHTSFCLLTSHLHSWFLLPYCNFHFFHSTYHLPTYYINEQFLYVLFIVCLSLLYPKHL